MVGVLGLEPRTSFPRSVQYRTNTTEQAVTTTIRHKRIVGYARVSGDKQAGEHHASLEIQESRAQEFAKRTDGEYITTFVDVLTGRRDDRPEYQRMLEFLATGNADVVVV